MRRAASYPLVLLFLFSAPAHAYLDPGVGSVVLQALAAAAIGVSLFWRGIIDKIKSIFRKNGEPDPAKSTHDRSKEES
jgi:hypothetical protein